MYNRKFDIRRGDDFHLLNELTNKVIPKIRKIEDKEESEYLQAFIRKIFDNQWKR